MMDITETVQFPARVRDRREGAFDLGRDRNTRVYISLGFRVEKKNNVLLYDKTAGVCVMKR